MIFRQLVFSTTQWAIICLFSIPTASFAQSVPITSFKGAKRANFNNAQLLALKPLVKYLRCEEDVLNQFGESSAPEMPLEVLRPKKANPNGHTPVHLEVWPGIQAEIKGDAGYGFFAMWQQYPVSSKDILLKAMLADGWQFKRSAMPTAQQVQNSTIINEMVAVHQATRPIANQPGRTRTLTLVEANQSLVVGDIDFDSITVSCAYSSAAKPEGKK